MTVDSIVNCIMSSVTYILSEESSDYVWLVDCGDADKIYDTIGEKRIKGVLLTHAHYDHIYGLPAILDTYHECIVYTNNAGVEGLESSRKNLSLYHEDPIEITRELTYTVKEGEEVRLFDGILARVFETPGHNPSCLCFDVGDWLFTGDAYIPDIPVVTNLPGGNKIMANKSKMRILGMISNYRVLPGHVV